MKRSIYIGYDPREADAYSVCRGSLLRHLSFLIPVRGLVLLQLQVDRLYTRRTERIAGRLVDALSRRPDYDGYMSTEFAISRFFVPLLAREGWALFMDSDMLVRDDIAKVFEMADPSKAVMCVKHEYEPTQAVKMDGQKQTAYARKNWSSFMLFNCDHPSNGKLTTELLNSKPGADLHSFCWLDDSEIGALPPRWNYLVGEKATCDNPAVIHYTNGTPNFAGYRNCAYSDEWFSELEERAA